MTLALTYHDVNEAYSEIQTLHNQFTTPENTRNGPAMVFITPVVITHTMPYRRVLFDPKRNANPFFHYMEALWMLGGRADVSFPAQFAQNIRNYSDDGVTLHGAYGKRWRYHWDEDQIETVIYMLRKDPTSRRLVIAMWDPAEDLEVESKDLPCNTHLYFRLQNKRLTMTVCNRSNDLVWGMLGSNIVHFSILQEYIAGAVGLEAGDLHQFTNNLHIYMDWVDKFEYKQSEWYTENPTFKRWPFSPNNLNLGELDDFLDGENKLYNSRILRDNATPMWDAWKYYKADKLDEAIYAASHIYDEDWKEGCTQWLKRRKDEHSVGKGGN